MRRVSLTGVRRIAVAGTVALLALGMTPAHGARFTHHARLPAGAELTVGRAPIAVRLQLPVLLGPALLTVHRPSEQWLEPGQWSAPADVQRRPRRPG